MFQVCLAHPALSSFYQRRIWSSLRNFNYFFLSSCAFYNHYIGFCYIKIFTDQFDQFFICFTVYWWGGYFYFVASIFKRYNFVFARSWNYGHWNNFLHIPSLYNSTRVLTKVNYSDIFLLGKHRRTTIQSIFGTIAFHIFGMLFCFVFIFVHRTLKKLYFLFRLSLSMFCYYIVGGPWARSLMVKCFPTKIEMRVRIPSRATP